MNLFRLFRLFLVIVVACVVVFIASGLISSARSAVNRHMQEIERAGG